LSLYKETRRLYLQEGDEVIHKFYPRWGLGVVVEECNSCVVGGFSYVRIAFSDGKVRVFNNNFDSSTCCYYMGIRRR
jgi:hypothetical protein